MNHSADKTTDTLSLSQIAAWQLPHLVDYNDALLPFVAELPSLQRGAVWKPGKIELIWDSIFRGFPIGSLVTSDYLEKQNSRPGAHANSKQSVWRDLDLQRKRHLLDGQQRCNAITLGYSDPFAEGQTSETSNTILWFDLFSHDLPPDSRRSFFRVTTLAYPCGYTIPRDWTNVDTLSAHAIRTFLDERCHRHTLPGQMDYQRPQPCDI